MILIAIQLHVNQQAQNKHHSLIILMLLRYNYFLNYVCLIQAKSRWAHDKHEQYTTDFEKVHGH